MNISEAKKGVRVVVNDTFTSKKSIGRQGTIVNLNRTKTAIRVLMDRVKPSRFGHIESYAIVIWHPDYLTILENQHEAPTQEEGTNVVGKVSS